MPVIAVVGAIAADAMAASAVAATVGGIAEITVTTALEVVAAVGATVGAIGAVTGNKTLQMVGAGLGLVGGIGAIASSAGAFGAAADSAGSVFGGSATAGDAAAGSVGANSDVISTMSNASGIPGYTGAATNIDAATAAIPNTSFSDAMASGAASSLQGPSSDSSADTLTLGDSNPSAGASTANAASTPVNTTPAAAQAPGGFSLANPPPPSLTVGADTPYSSLGASNIAGAGTGSTTPTTLDGILNFVKQNQMLSYGIAQAAGSLISGATSTLTPAQVGALNSQAAANQAAANLTTMQTANLSQPRSIATLAPVTGAPQNIVTTPSAGMINSAPAVTGAPA